MAPAAGFLIEATDHPQARTLELGSGEQKAVKAAGPPAV